MNLISIAIDGPAGAGKSTFARRLASEFGLIYIDTGAIYRTVGYAAQLAGLKSRDAEGVAAMLPSLSIEIRYDGEGVQKMFLGGRDVSTEIRTPVSSIYASDVSAMPAVRAYLLELQRCFAKKYSVVMDGRDIGTVVLPDASLKVFITADAAVRARRRYDELIAKGTQTDYETVYRDLCYRDEQDAKRPVAPLAQAEDAVLLDTSLLDLETSYRALRAIVTGRFGEAFHA